MAKKEEKERKERESHKWKVTYKNLLNTYERRTGNKAQ